MRNVSYKERERLSAEIAGLESLDLSQLRARWKLLYETEAPVATENSESGGKSRVLALAALVSPAWISSSDRSFLGLYADSVVGRLWSWRTSPSVISCTFFAASGRVGSGCSRSTACSGSGFTDCGRVVWRRWCWSSRQR